MDGFDKFYFINDWDVPKDMVGELILESGVIVDCVAPGIKEVVESDIYFNRCLLITSGNNAPETWNKITDIKFLDGKPAFEIYEN